MSTIIKKDLIDRITEKTQAKHALVKATVQSFLDEVISELAKGNRLEFRDFGVFEVREQAARVAQNPKTLERIEVPAKRKVKFKMGRLMREGMNEHP
jgi:integration host factor subunit beta